MLKNIFIVLTEKMRRMERKVGNTFSLFTVRIYFYFLEKAKKPSLVFSGGHKMGTFIINGVRTCHGITNQSFSELCGEFINFMNTYCISKKLSNFFHQFTLISQMFWLLIIQFVKLVFKGRDPHVELQDETIDFTQSNEPNTSKDRNYNHEIAKSRAVTTTC